VKSYKAKLALLLIILAFYCLPLLCQTQAAPPPNYYDENAGTIENPYQISNLANLRWLSETEEFFSFSLGHHDPLPLQTYMYFIQTADIDASETMDWNNGRGFKPIGLGTIATAIPENFALRCFYGSYNGNDFAISGLHIRYSDISDTDNDVELGYVLERGLGLFGVTHNSEIINTHLQKANYEIHLTGNLNQHITTINIGSLAGSMSSGSVKNCSATGYIFMNALESSHYRSIHLGGLIGSVSTLDEINKCFSKINIVDISIVENSNAIGGLLGRAYGANIVNSYYFGDIINNSSSGMQGGLIGLFTSSIIENCYVASNVQFVNAKGLFGIVDSVPNIPICTVTNTFWDINSTGTTNPYYSISAGLAIITTGLPSNQMKLAETYIQAGWDFNEIWAINPDINNGYPYLQSLPLILSDTDETTVALKSKLLGNYPNPFNPSTTIKYILTQCDKVRLQIFNIKGQHVKTLVNTNQDAGSYSILWNGDDFKGASVASGVYFYRLETKNHKEVKRMLLMK